MIEIIPAIDLIDGKCVRLSQGDFDRVKIYGQDPVDVAKEFEAAGLRRLHMVDLEGAKTGKITNLRVLESVVAATNLVIDFGGGISTDGDLKSVFDAGAAMANLGSIAVKAPETFVVWLTRYGPDRFLLGADVRNGLLSINGWQTTTDIEIIQFLSDKMMIGVRKVFITSVANDGLLQGPSTELYQRILSGFPDLDLTASGGVRDLDDVRELERIGCSGVIIGKAIYEGRISMDDLGRFNANR